MAKKMLIDAMHPEETRVVVTDGQRVEDFDFESKVKKSYKSNIYLAKVTRVEPSLQAAFVNYGGNRHGFLPFSEIHPDYYRIPIEDRERLMKEQEELAKKLAEREEAQDEENGDDDKLEEELDALIEEVNAEINSLADDESDEDDDDDGDDSDDETAEDDESDDDADDESEEDDDDNAKKKSSRSKKRQPKRAAKKQTKSKDDEVSEEAEDESDEDEDDDSDDDDNNNGDDDDSDENDDNQGNKKSNNNRQKGRYRGRRRGRRGRGRYNKGSNNKKKNLKSVGGDDIEDDPVTLLWKKMRRAYKIQEVIKRGQIVLVQCQKEERGNKGAAMTTYITLPGRYGVLMPNSPRGGGISRKIGWSDRKKLKDVLKEVTIPQGMSVILRTAAVGRTKTEIKRDLDYLYKLWDTIRELTLKSNAPALVYEEGELVKRAVRDLYTRDVEEIHVAGEQAYKETRDIMKMMIPSHVKRVKLYKDDEFPLFTRYQVEDQIDEIYDPQVSLKSGGYLVIHPTEALVSIDVNSGRSTKERNIEGTALKTNLESADEVARQLRLRDLGGLVVIDFIDMENYKNNREVERRLTEALSKDRARVQIGRISNFGLMELSRQRLRPSLTDTHFETCRHCQGAGTIRTKETAALRVLRKIEGEAIKGKCGELRVDVPTDIGLYILNSKRLEMAEIEKRHDMSVYFVLKDEMTISEYEMTKVSGKKPSQRQASNDQNQNQNDQSDDQDDKGNDQVSESNDDDVSDDNDNKGGGNNKRSNRGKSSSAKSKSRNSRRNSKKSSNDKDDETQSDNQDDQNKNDQKSDDEKKDDKDKKPASKGRGRKKAPAKKDDASQFDDSSEAQAKSDQKDDEAEKKPAPKKRTSRSKSKAKSGDDKSSEASNDDSKAKNDNADKEYETVNPTPEKKKKGWWNKILD